jgi:hypothetical protein
LPALDQHEIERSGYVGPRFVPQVADALKRGIHKLHPGLDVDRVRLEHTDSGELRPQVQHEPAAETETAIGIRFLSGAELALQYGELIAHLRDRARRRQCR